MASVKDKPKMKKAETLKVPARPSYRWMPVFLFLLSIVIYVNTIGHEYALDDTIVVKENKFTKQGISGIADIFSYDSFAGFFGKDENLLIGGRYRPLSIATFAIEYEFFGLNPHISHVINILLYAFLGLLLYNILNKLFPINNPNKWYTSIAFWTSLIFIVHPLHTEVVANIKGRDEIIALLGSLLILKWAINYAHTEKSKYLFFIFPVWLAALLSKENAATFLFIVPLTLWLFKIGKSNQRLVSLIPMVLALLVFFIIRYLVLGGHQKPIDNELMNNPFLGTSFMQKYATIFYTLGLYLKLLVFPYPLTYDYYPYHIPIMSWANWQSWLSLILYVGMGIMAIAMYRKRPAIAYSILFYLICLSVVSNLFFPIGTFMNERFLFFSSIGFCLLMGFLLVKWLERNDDKKHCVAKISLVSVIALVFTIESIARNPVWKNDFTLFTHDVEISKNSAKGNCTAGGALFEKAQKTSDSLLKKEYLERSFKYLHRSVAIYPTYIDALLLLGNTYFEYNRNYDSAWYCYKTVLHRNPKYELAWKNLVVILTPADEPTKFRIYSETLQFDSNFFEANYNIGISYGRFRNNLPKSIYYLERAVKIKPGSLDALKDLGVAYGISGKLKESAKVLEEAVKLAPNDAQLLSNLGYTYQQLGMLKEANTCFAKAQGEKK